MDNRNTVESHIRQLIQQLTVRSVRESDIFRWTFWSRLARKCLQTPAPVSILVERFSAPNPTDSARFHYFCHIPLTRQSPTRVRGRIWVARLVLTALILNRGSQLSLFLTNYLSQSILAIVQELPEFEFYLDPGELRQVVAQTSVASSALARCSILSLLDESSPRNIA